MTSSEKGRLGEELIAGCYEKNGYRILERNWHWGRRGELDIIAISEDGEVLTVCEVKTRKKGSLSRPCEAINRAKMKKLITLARVYASGHRELNDANIRFDVAEVEIKADGTADIESINIIYNAFNL